MMTELTKRGYIYILISAYNMSLIKIGRTQNNPAERAYQISKGEGAVGSWYPFAFWRVSDCWLAEQRAHTLFKNNRVQGVGGREIFEVSAAEAVCQIRDIANDLPDKEESIEGLPESFDPVDVLNVAPLESALRGARNLQGFTVAKLKSKDKEILSLRKAMSTAKTEVTRAKAEVVKLRGNLRAQGAASTTAIQDGYSPIIAGVLATKPSGTDGMVAHAILLKYVGESPLSAVQHNAAKHIVAYLGGDSVHINGEMLYLLSYGLAALESDKHPERYVWANAEPDRSRGSVPGVRSKSGRLGRGVDRATILAGAIVLVVVAILVASSLLLTCSRGPHAVTTATPLGADLARGMPAKPEAVDLAGVTASPTTGPSVAPSVPRPAAAAPVPRRAPTPAVMPAQLLQAEDTGNAAVQANIQAPDTAVTAAGLQLRLPPEIAPVAMRWARLTPNELSNVRFVRGQGGWSVVAPPGTDPSQLGQLVSRGASVPEAAAWPPTGGVRPMRVQTRVRVNIHANSDLHSQIVHVAPRGGLLVALVGAVDGHDSAMEGDDSVVYVVGSSELVGWTKAHFMHTYANCVPEPTTLGRLAVERDGGTPRGEPVTSRTAMYVHGRRRDVFIQSAVSRHSEQSYMGVFDVEGSCQLGRQFGFYAFEGVLDEYFVTDTARSRGETLLLAGSREVGGRDADGTVDWRAFELENEEPVWQAQLPTAAFLNRRQRASIGGSRDRILRNQPGFVLGVRRRGSPLQLFTWSGGTLVLDSRSF